MAGCQTLPRRGGRFAAALAVCFLTSAGGARAQNPSPPVPPAGMPDASIAEIVDSVTAPEDARPMTAPGPAYYPAYGAAPTAPRVETGIFATIAESIFGQPDPDTWRPLPLSTLFSEGWNEAWVPSPNGSGGAPAGLDQCPGRQPLPAVVLHVRSGVQPSPKGDGYLGAFTIFTPLSRRLDLIINVPFVLRNNAVTGLPIIDPNRPGAATTQSHTGFGDMSFTPRVLLHETKDFSLTSELAVVTPTGTQPLAGKTTTLVPAVAFWNNFAGGWVLRGGLGLAIPMNGSGDNLISQLAIGQTLTGHDVRLFGDFTYYLSTVVNTPLANGDQTSVTLTPGMRTHLGNNWYFLAGSTQRR